MQHLKASVSSESAMTKVIMEVNRLKGRVRLSSKKRLSVAFDLPDEVDKGKLRKKCPEITRIVEDARHILE